MSKAIDLLHDSERGGSLELELQRVQIRWTMRYPEQPPRIVQEAIAEAEGTGLPVSRVAHDLLNGFNGLKK